MTIEIWLAYFTTLLIFMVTPGPSHVLMLSNSLSSGFPRSFATACGDLTANIIQICIAALGLGTLLYRSQEVFIVVKWLGVIYLVYLGIKIIAKGTLTLDVKERQVASISKLFWQGFITSAANPKAILFFASLLPQFVTPGQPVGQQFFILGATYIIVDGCFLSGYGMFAGWIGAKALSNTWLNKLSGILVIVAAVLLGMKEVKPS